MRLAKALLSGVAALALSTGAAFAGGELYQSYEQGGPAYSMQSDEYEVYEVYVVPEVAVVDPGVDSEGNPLNVIN